jgi:hypothetical protein
MSEVVETFPAAQGRPPIYPWSEWTVLDQIDEEGRPCSRIYKLYRGEDFKGQARSFRVLAHRTAKNAGLKVSTAIVDGGEAIIIEFYQPEE